MPLTFLFQTNELWSPGNFQFSVVVTINLHGFTFPFSYSFNYYHFYLEAKCVNQAWIPDSLTGTRSKVKKNMQVQVRVDLQRVKEYSATRTSWKTCLRKSSLSPLLSRYGLFTFKLVYDISPPFDVRWNKKCITFRIEQMHVHVEAGVQTYWQRDIVVPKGSLFVRQMFLESRSTYKEQRKIKLLKKKPSEMISFSIYVFYRGLNSR